MAATLTSPIRIHRFKGQQAPAVIFCEIDFEHFDDSAKRRLYCGMTRASVAIDLPMTPATMQIIARALKD